MTRFRLLPVALAVLLLAGCNTFERRARQNPSLFAALSPEQRAKLQHGVIEIGNTPDMVYLALGAPDEKRETTTAAGREELWIYNSYHTEFEGNVRTGVIRHVVFNPARKTYVVYHEPVYTDVYSQHTEEHIRIIFRDGKVAVIEQPKR